MWPNFGEIIWNSCKDIVFIRFLQVIACCDLDLWHQNLTSTSTNRNTYVTKIGWNCLHWFSQIWCWESFRFIESNQHLYEPKYVRDQNWVKLLLLVFAIRCSQGFWDAQTHSLTDGQTRTQNASGTVFSCGRAQKHALTLSPPIPLRLYTLPYWSNPPFLTFDIRALWRSVLSARMSKIKNGRLDQYSAEPFEQQQFGTAGVERVNRLKPSCSQQLAIRCWLQQ